MNKEQIIDAIEGLASSQGSYKRLYNQITDGSESSEQLLKLMEEQGFNDIVDMIMWFES